MGNTSTSGTRGVGSARCRSTDLVYNKKNPPLAGFSVSGGFDHFPKMYLSPSCADHTSNTEEFLWYVCEARVVVPSRFL